MDAKYLYGDGRASHYTSNILDLVEAAFAFAVPALLATREETRLARRRAERTEVVEKSIGALRQIAAEVASKLRTAHEDAAVVAWSIMVERDLRARLVEQERHLRDQLAAELARLESDETRRAWQLPLLELLARRDLPGSSRALQGELTDDGYLLERTFRTTWGIAASVTLDPLDTIWKAPVRAGTFDKKLGSKLMGEPLARMTVASFRRGSGKTTVTLRQGSAAGIDVVFGGPGRIFLLRPPESRPSLAEGALKDDLSRLGSLLGEACNALEGQLAGRATFRLDERPLEHCLDETVERLVAQLAPDVAEIARRSPSGDELVLKRVLEGNRREEVFLERRQLAARTRELSPAQRAMLAPLGLASDAGAPLPRLSPGSDGTQSTPAGPRKAPWLARDPDDEQERTAHGPGSPSRAPVEERTLTSAGIQRDPDSS